MPDFKPYTGQIIPTSIPYGKTPVEGFRMVPIQIDFATSQFTNVNLQAGMGQPQQPLSFIQSVYVDNTRNGNDIFITFDGGFTLEVSAYAQNLYPVFTNTVVFNISPRVELLNNSGTTRLYLMNYFLPGFSVSEFQETIMNAIGSGGVVTNLRVGDKNIAGVVPWNGAFPITVVSQPFFITSVDVTSASMFGTGDGTAFFQILDDAMLIYETVAHFSSGVVFPGVSSGKDMQYISVSSFMRLNIVTTVALTNGFFAANISYGLQ